MRHRSRWILACIAVALALPAVLLWQSPGATSARSDRTPPRAEEPPAEGRAAEQAKQASAPEEPPRRRTLGPAPFRGTVRFRDGAPAVGLAISWWPKGPFAVTNADGQFTWERVGRGREQVFLDTGGGNYLQLGHIDVAPGGTGVIEIDRGFAVGGTIRAARDGTPLPQAEVTLRRVGGHSVVLQAAGSHAKADNLARFSFPFVPEGSYTLLIRAKGYEPLMRTIELVRPMGDEVWLLRDARQIVVRIDAEGAAWEGRTFVVQIERWQDLGFFEETRISPEQRDGARIPAPAPGYYRAHLLFVGEGHLRDTEAREDLVVEDGAAPVLRFRVPKGGPVAGTITLPDGLPLANRPGQLRAAGYSQNLETDGRGAFELPFVPDGRYQVRVFSGMRGFRYSRPFVVAGGAEVTIRIDGTAEITGRIEPEPTGAFDNPVEIAQDAETVAVVYQDNGSFRADWLEPGRYSVRIAGESPLEVVLGEGESKDIGVLTAPPMVLLPVEVVVPAGAGVPDLLRIEGDGIEETLVTLDPKGRGLVSWPLGRRKAVVRARGFRDASVELALEPGSQVLVRITLERP